MFSSVSDKDESQEHLLGEPNLLLNKSRPSKLLLRIHYYISGVLILLLLYISIILTVQLRNNTKPIQRPDGSTNHFRLPQDAIRYEDKQEWYTLRHPWNLEPSDELDDHWDDLLYALNIRVTPEEMKLLNMNTTNRIQVDGGDYLGVLGVYHHLHCLNNLRKLIHWDYYESRVTHKEVTGHAPFQKGHSDHCINGIRQALMCHANTELHTGVWIKDVEKPRAPKLGSHSLSRCVAWDSLANWAEARALRKGEYTYRPVPLDG